MPSTKRTPTIGPLRLTPEDHQRFAEIVRTQGRPQTDVLRDAVRFYMDNYQTTQEAAKEAARDRLIVESLKRMENRFASLMVRLGIDIETLYGYLWTTADRTKRDKIFQEARATGVYRFKKKLEAMEVEFKSQLSKQPNKLG